MWREPCANSNNQRISRINGLAACQDRILFDKSHQISSVQMRYAQQIRNSRGGTTSFVPVTNPIIATPQNKF